MNPYGIVVFSLLFIHDVTSQCGAGRSMTFARWSGVSPEGVPPVFVYSASGEEESLAGACLARCRELPDCAGVVVSYGRGNCHGVADAVNTQLRVDNDVAYFKKTCLEVAEECSICWWALESTPGYHLLSESARLKVLYNTTMSECYDAVLAPHGNRMYRSAQWVVPEGAFDAELLTTSDSMLGNCILNEENKFTEPESFRVANYYTFYIENQCRHDYPKKIDRCSYEEYYNQTLRHVEYTVKNYTKDECKAACELSDHFVCRGFTWTPDRRVSSRGRGLCDLHSEDLVTTGSWLLRRTAAATYYRRVICLNITVDCEGTDMVVTYRPRGMFRGRVYVPGRGERCSARGTGSTVRLSLPLQGDCDVNFAYGISKGPNGLINRTMAYVMVMIQNNPIIQTAGDRWVRVGCSPGAPRPAARLDATFTVRDVGTGYRKPSSMSDNEIPHSVSPAAASAVYKASSAPVSMYVVRARAAAGAAGAGAVSLGEPLELWIETTDTDEVTAYHLVASSRLGDSSVLLLDSRGCPTGQVDFPAFSRSWQGGTQRLASRFKAFRFPTSHIVRFALTVKFCEDKCTPVDCHNKNQGRTARQTNDTFYQWSDNETSASVRQDSRPEAYRSGVVAQGGAVTCAPSADDSQTLELEMVVDSKDMLSADTLVRADHQSTLPEDLRVADSTMVCVHELLLVALALTWLAIQVLLLLGCCVLVKRYRNLAELSMQKDYHSFDNVGFESGSTHRRVHWPDQHIDVLHT